ncbi:hypothetical protein RJ640_022655 [Escallonia rubra]|uniref:Prolamin-like domain-containing protein n=1 Tax=Escallonia rubra TaxID=112253 RepID=A0AA88RDD9_9ASTE|nr:hypothetical protein RJ640_022655 [Escallonia rubra]
MESGRSREPCAVRVESGRAVGTAVAVRLSAVVCRDWRMERQARKRKAISQTSKATEKIHTRAYEFPSTMAVKSLKTLSTMLVITIMATSVMSRVTLLAPPPVSLSSKITVFNCWKPLSNIEGCLIGIYKALTTGQAGLLSAPCCQAFTNIIDGTCWDQLFPLNPKLPLILKTFCDAPALSPQ